MNIFYSVIGFLLLVFVVVSWLFGFEPQIMGRNAAEGYYIRNSTFEEYMRESLEYNDNTFPVKILTTIAYPGAKIGRLIVNKKFAYREPPPEQLEMRFDK